MIELLVGLALAVGLASALAPLFISLERAGVESADRSVQTVQSRVAVARFERDLRFANGTGCLFPTGSLLVEATATKVVLLLRPQPEAAPIIVAWEVAGSNLMRRWGMCPPSRPLSYPTALFSDNKTMLEGVRTGSRFTYLLGSKPIEPPLSTRALAAIDGVRLDLELAPFGVSGASLVSTTARVGR